MTNNCSLPTVVRYHFNYKPSIFTYLCTHTHTHPPAFQIYSGPIVTWYEVTSVDQSGVQDADKKSPPRHLSSSSKDSVQLGCTSTPALTKFGPCPLVLSFVNPFVSEPKTVSSEGGIFIHQQGLHQCNVPWKQPRSNCNQSNFICVEVLDNGRCKFKGVLNNCSEKQMLQFEPHWRVAVVGGLGFVPLGLI
ncbi:hypothetical protein J6590_076630 [Homalodisca vitripennis]|nr:hypothetical protein J6590_076630 [Homalodisca vitripennis]